MVPSYTSVMFSHRIQPIRVLLQLRHRKIRLVHHRNSQVLSQKMYPAPGTPLRRHPLRQYLSSHALSHQPRKQHSLAQVLLYIAQVARVITLLAHNSARCLPHQDKQADKIALVPLTLRNKKGRSTELYGTAQMKVSLCRCSHQQETERFRVHLPQIMAMHNTTMALRLLQTQQTWKPIML